MSIRSNIQMLLLSACTLLCACRQNVISEPADFVFSTENIEGEETFYSKPAVITGHIVNRDVYPNVTEIGITIPFYDRVDNRQTSLIYEDRFGFSVLPYAPRTISMAPYVDHIVVCPGDSVHIEIDFSDLGKVRFSGNGTENNVKMNEFHMYYYLSHDWPSHSNYETAADGTPVRKYKDAAGLNDALEEKLAYHLSRLEAFIKEKHPSKELEALCRKEIEADYFSTLIQGLLSYKNAGEDVSAYFRIKEKYGDSHQLILYVYCNDSEEMKAEIKEFGLEGYTVISDFKGRATQFTSIYNCQATPTCIYTDAEGIIVNIMEGLDTNYLESEFILKP